MQNHSLDFESKRIQTLRRSQLLDSPPEQAFDEVVRMLADVCQVPIALISLIDSDRQWFKAKVGIDESETERDVSFCTHAIANGEETMVVRDATEDPRFMMNPLVVGDPNIRFYAGSPILVDGAAVGTVCLVDTEPRELAAKEQKLLESLSRHVSNLIEIRLQSNLVEKDNEDLAALVSEVSEKSHFLSSVLNATTGYICVFGEQGIVLTANQELRTLCDTERVSVLQRHFAELFGEAEQRQLALDSLERVRAGSKQEQFEAAIGQPGKSPRQVAWKICRLPNQADYGSAYVLSGTDITERCELEARLVAANAFGEAILDSADMAIVATDRRGRVVTFSEGASKLLGYATNEIIGRYINLESLKCEEPSHPFVSRNSRRRAFLEHVSSVQELPRAWSCEAKSGERIPIQASFARVDSKKGDHLGFLAIAQDDRRRIESERILKENLERLRSLVDNLPACAVLIQGDQLHANAFVRKLTGFEPDEVRTRQDWFSLLHPGRNLQAERQYRDHILHSPHEPMYTKVMTKTGSTKTLEMAVFVGEEEEVWLLTDVSERLASQEALKKSEELFRVSTENLQSGVVVFDQSMQISLCNPKGQEILAQSIDQILGRVPPDPKWGAIGTDGKPLPEDEYPAVIAMRTGNIVQDCIHGLTLPSGGVKWISVNAAPICDDRGKVLGAVASFTDVTDALNLQNQLEQQMAKISDYSVILELRSQELEAANRRLEVLAITDGLTGLLNHRTFQDRLSEAFDRSWETQSPLSVVMIDVDDFKKYNDEFGHPAGDILLEQFGATLARTARSGDVVARYGGEEFVVLLPDASLVDALEAAERFRRAIAAYDWPLRQVTASFGVATRDEGALSRSQLLSMADRALYVAKKDGKNRVATLQRMQNDGLDLVA